MARRRRAFSSRSCSFAFFLTDLACFKERTSFVISKLAQSRRRWFTESNLDVSLLASDAEPSDHKSNEESLVLVASDPRSFQIWRARSSPAATFLYLVDRDPSKERTSFVISNFAQSRRRRFTDSKPGVSLLGSDAEPSDHKTYGESLVVVASDPGSFQIWQASSFTAAIFLYFVDRDLFSEHIRRLFRHIQCLPPHNLRRHRFGLVLVAGDSGLSQIWRVHLPTSASLRFFPSFAAAVPAWCFNRNASNSQAAGQNLGFQVMGQSWASQVMGLLLILDLLGLMDPKLVASPHLNVSSSLSPCRLRLWSSLAAVICLDSHLIACQEVFSATPFNWWISPMSLSFLRVMIRQDIVMAKSSLLLWRLCAENILLLGGFELPRYQISFCRGQKRTFPSSSLLKERTFSPLPSVVLIRFSYRFPYAARVTFVCEECCAETLFSVIFKGSPNMCLVAFGIVAELRIVVSALVAVAILNNRSLLVLFVSHGFLSLPASNVIKIRRRRDDVYCLKFKIVFIYPFLYCFYLSCWVIVATMLLDLNVSFVTNSSIDGE